MHGSSTSGTSSSGGISTVSIKCTTPLVAPISAAITVAASLRINGSLDVTVSRSPFNAVKTGTTLKSVPERKAGMTNKTKEVKKRE